MLARALHDEEPMVREHAAWALDSIRARGSAVYLSSDAPIARRHSPVHPASA